MGETQPQASPGVADPICHFLEYLRAARNYSPQTLRAYDTDLRSLAKSFATTGEFDPTRLTATDIRKWVAEQIEAGGARPSVARRLSAVRSFLKFLMREEVLDRNVAQDVRTRGGVHRLPQVLDEDEAKRLVEAPDPSTPAGSRDRAMLEVMYGCGLRVSECVGLNVQDLNFPETQVLVSKGKGQKSRIVPLGRFAIEALQKYLVVRLHLARGYLTDALFINRRGGRLSVRGAFRTVFEYGVKMGLRPRIGPHTLRHSCASHMLNRGAGIRDVQEMLGHKSIGTTQIYTHVSPQHLKEVYDKAFANLRRSGDDPGLAAAGSRGENSGRGEAEQPVLLRSHDHPETIQASPSATGGHRTYPSRAPHLRKTPPPGVRGRGSNGQYESPPRETAEGPRNVLDTAAAAQ